MRSTLLAIAATLVLSQAPARATNVINHQGLDWGRGMYLQFSADGNNRTARAGVGQMLVDGFEIFDVFCVNLFVGIAVGNNYTADSVTASAFDPANGGHVAWLVSTYLASVDTAVEGAAMQFLIWDLIHDGGDGFASGRIRSNSSTLAAVVAQAEAWRAQALLNSGEASVFVAPPGAPRFQEQMYIPGLVVPEPAAIVTLGLGAVLGALARRFRRR